MLDRQRMLTGVEAQVRAAYVALARREYEKLRRTRDMTYTLAAEAFCCMTLALDLDCTIPEAYAMK